MTQSDTSSPVEAADTLDRMANPHPRMWARAQELYARRNDHWGHACLWVGYLEAMCAATGYTSDYFLDKLAGE